MPVLSYDKGARMLKSRWRPRSLEDLSLVSMGVAVAFSSAAFAVYMLASDIVEPRVGGLEHLGIFARPKTLAFASRTQKTIPDRSKPPTIDDPLVDPMPVGTIPGGVATPYSASKSFQIIPTLDDRVWIETNSGGFVRVGKGDYLAAFGRIKSIERNGRQLIVVSDPGARIASANPDEQNNERRSPAALAPRKSIFDLDSRK